MHCHGFDCCPQENYGGEDWALLEIWTLARRPHGPVSGLGAFGGLIEPSAESETTRVAREYYDSADADNFYYEVWGGEDLHLGWYESPNESIKQASVRPATSPAASIPRPRIREGGPRAPPAAPAPPRRRAHRR